MNNGNNSYNYAKNWNRGDRRSQGFSNWGGPPYFSNDSWGNDNIYRNNTSYISTIKNVANISNNVKRTWGPDGRRSNNYSNRNRRGWCPEKLYNVDNTRCGMNNFDSMSSRAEMESVRNPNFYNNMQNDWDWRAREPVNYSNQGNPPLPPQCFDDFYNTDENCDTSLKYFIPHNAKTSVVDGSKNIPCDSYKDMVGNVDWENNNLEIENSNKDELLINNICNDDENEETEWNSDYFFKFKKKPKSSAKVDYKNRRVISKETLLQDPELIEDESDINTDVIQVPEESEQEIFLQSPDSQYDAGYDWTNTTWQKASNVLPNTQTKQKPKSSIVMPKNKKLQKNLKGTLVALSKPVKLSKAENMMQKMGWEGGALGKSGNGIVEPLKPEVFYGSRTGFGQQTSIAEKEQIAKSKKKKPAAQPQLRKKVKRALDLEKFKRNLLIQILEFVKNDYEVEIAFDKRLTGKQRRDIHCMVNEVINEWGTCDMNFNSLIEMDLLRSIEKANIFHLATESQGEGQNRYLCLFKEAPNYMYLLTPQDLRKEKLEDEDLKEKNDKTDNFNDEEDVIEMCETSDIKDANEDVVEVGETCDIKDANEDDVIETRDDAAIERASDNTFIKNTKKQTCKNETKPAEDVIEKFQEHCRISTETAINFDALRKLVEYFSEFIEDEIYTQFRYLGTFNSDEIATINYFLRNYIDLIKLLDDKKSILEDLENTGFYLECIEDKNGSIVFYKRSQSDPGN